MNMIEIRNVTKKFKRYKKQEGLVGSLKGLFKREYEEKVAVDNISISIKEGEFVGLIGPNGAGKTTLVKMLTGIIASSSGDINVLGFNPNKLQNEFKQQYAVVMGQKSQLFFELTTEDTLRLFKELYSISDDEFKKTTEYFIDLFEVRDLMNVQVRTLSLGERMKMELIVALLHNPKILFLDEPTIGLDAIAAKQIRNFLKEVNVEKGTTIILTSHYMEDIKTLCNRSIVINHGKKIYDGETEKLFAEFQHSKKITLVFETPTEPAYMNSKCHFQIIEQTPYRCMMEVPKEEAGKMISYIMKYSPSDISVEEEEIGNVVARIYQEGICQ